MKKIMEAIKANKGIILKRGLIVLGAVAGMTLVGKVLMSKDNDSEDCENDSETEVTDDDEDSEEE
jgi:ligand-binding sensor protein